jgi:leucyl-tRNA synthetase
MEKAYEIKKGDYEKFIQILAPFAPHISDEIWHNLDNKKSVHISDWPKYDEDKIVDNKIKIAVQVMGKVRGVFETVRDSKQNEVVTEIQKMPEIQKWLAGKEIIKTIFVPNKIVNFVIE